ncbi:MAG: hypothetical protein QF464_24155, partial [Myxococcota bacterium]|nr:hypothetical protein [Myxococcota bacterium]
MKIWFVITLFLGAGGCGTSPLADTQEGIASDTGFTTTDVLPGSATDSVNDLPVGAGAPDVDGSGGDVVPLVDTAPLEDETSGDAPGVDGGDPWAEDTLEPDGATCVGGAGAGADVSAVEHTHQTAAPGFEDAGADAASIEPYEPCAEENLDVDTDGDGLSDCDEITDGLESTDPTRFNGLTATVGIAPEGLLTSAQCGLFFGTDYGELDQHFGSSNQTMSIRSGWEYLAGNTAEYGDAS